MRRNGALPGCVISLAGVVNDWSILEYVKVSIFWGAFALFPLGAWLILLVRGSGGAKRIIALLLLALTLLLAYARFIEPRILLDVRHRTELAQCFPEAGAARLAVFSDTHEGLFRNAMPIARIARRINAIAPDAVLIAGDFTYFLAPDQFDETFHALGGVGAPVFAVLGNHDVGLPGPDVGAALSARLAAIGVRMLDDDVAELRIKGRTLEIVGLSDLWARHQETSLVIGQLARPRIVLAHNPDTVRELPLGARLDLMVAGHTHGGQVYFPGLTCALLPMACSVTRYGFADVGPYRVFVTSGTGMVGLPLRFNTPPRIDVVDVSWRACATQNLS